MIILGGYTFLCGFSNRFENMKLTIRESEKVNTTFENVNNDMFGKPTYSNKEFIFYTNDCGGKESCFVLNVGK